MHRMLSCKLIKHGIGGNIFDWLKSYLSNRYQCFIISGKASNWIKVKSSVLQCSILGPLLFLLYIDDISQVIRESQIAQLADDSKIKLNINSVNDCVRLQTDVDAICNWCTGNGMNSNINKCTTILKNIQSYSYCQIYTNLQMTINTNS